MMRTAALSALWVYAEASKINGYDAKSRRAMSVRGGTDFIPVPASMTSGFDSYGKG